MSITCEILGAPGRDNALYVRVDSGQAVTRLLFDCGEGCLSMVPIADLLQTDHLFLSHLHMDHISGFDSFFRHVFNRDSRPNHIWGPVGTTAILHHRFQGFLWNLHADMTGTWYVHDVSESTVSTSRFELHDAFTSRSDEGCCSREHVLVDQGQCTIAAHVMNHGTPSLAYVVREHARTNIDTSRLAELGLQPGPWMKQLKDTAAGTSSVMINGVSHSIATLRDSLVSETPGDSLAYLTDFLLDEAATTYLADVLQGCGTMVCEAQYRNSDRELSLKNFHMTTGTVGELARQADVGRLLLLHLSQRYSPHEWREMLTEVQAVFPRASYAETWQI